MIIDIIITILCGIALGLCFYTLYKIDKMSAQLDEIEYIVDDE